MKACAIVSGGPFSPLDGIGRADFVIACDKGCEYTAACGIKPDLLVGDFDSYTGEKPEDVPVLGLPCEKDDTDTMLAVKTGFERGYDRFIIYGGVGGRPDHTFANYQTLCYISRRGGRGYLCFNGYTACCITDGEMNFPAREGTLSVFAMSGKAEGVTLRGVLYPLESTVLSYDFPLGVSNEFTGKPATVSVKKGTLLVIWQGSADAPE